MLKRHVATAVAVLIGLVAALVGLESSANAADPPTLHVDPDSPGLTFDGVGSLSAGASSRLLVDYPKKQRDQILDYLFKPGYGAAQQILKVEIGGDTNSTDGTEPSHMHSRDDMDCSRGYEWWLMKEAKARNPEIKLDALAWGAPGWIGNGNFWSQDMIDYLMSWLGCADQHGLKIDYLGGWNEKGYNAQWFIDLKKALIEHGYGDIKLVADDSWSWSVADEMVRNPKFADAVDVIGNHYICGYLGDYKNCPSSDAARSLGKPLRASEQGSQRYDTGAVPWARALNRSYVDGEITSSVNWSTVWSAYSGLPFEGDGLMNANEPWSGAYVVGESIWVTAHTTQFTQPGWKYVDDASQRIDGGSVETLRSPDNSDWSSIVETADATEAQDVDYQVDPALDHGVVHVWDTDLSSDNADDWFVQRAEVPVDNGHLEFTAQPGHLYSLTTTTGQGKGTATSPASTAWRLPYQDSFDSYATGKTPKYFSDIGGVFETAPCTGGHSGTCLRSVIDHQPIQWNGVANYPLTVVGDPNNWRDYQVQVDALLEQSGGVELAGRSHNGETGYRLKVQDDGTWTLWRGGDKVTLASGTTSMGVDKWHSLSLDFKGDRISAQIDDKTLATVHDSTYTAGQVDIAGSPWTTFQLDNLNVTPHQQPGVPTVSVPSGVARVASPGGSFQVSATVRNPGPSDTDITPSLAVPDGWTVQAGSGSATSLAPGESTTLTWTVTTPTDATPGAYSADVSIAYRSAGVSGSEHRAVDVRLGAVPHAEMTATASSAQGADYAASKAIDDSTTTMWHTQWSPLATLPQWLQVDLGDVRRTSGLTYLPRQDGNHNGYITKYQVEVSQDGTTWTQVADGSWASDGAAKTAAWTQAPARFVRLTALEGGGGYASAADLDVYAAP